MARMKGDATIPEEIIVEIVTRLPIKSVGRCRCVCKRWCSLFSDPKFAKSHMQSAIERRALSYRLVLLTDVYQSPYLDLGELKKSSVRLGQLNAPFKKQGRGLCFLGYCNGLVACFTFEPRLVDRFDSLFIWNPSTGFYKEITVPWKGFELTWGVDKRGFGHVSGTNDYKVVLKVKYREIDIFSIRTLTWNSIKFPPSTYQDNGVLLREALHWLAYDDPYLDNDDREAVSVESWEKPIFVFALDLAKEEFQKMQGPCTKLVISYGPSGSRLGVSSEGCLYVMNLSGSLGIDYAVDFWVMREYGNSETWTRSYSLRFSNEPDYPIYRLEPILLMENCAVVMNMPDDDKPGGDKSKILAEADMNMVHVDSKHENATSLYILHSNILHSFPPDMNVYEESLNEYEEGEEGQKALISSTSHKA